MPKRPSKLRLDPAFTIVELLIVIVVIAILATIAIVAYRGIQDRAKESTVKSDLTQAAKTLAADSVISGAYPTTVNQDGSGDAAEGKGLPKGSTKYEYTVNNTTGTFCLSGVNGNKAYHITNGGLPEDGVCPGHSGPSGGESTVIADGVHIQKVTATNCPTTRTRAVDARDNHTYWVQKMADGKCWMLTNLAYAGGGTNTYGDTKVLSNGTSDSTVTYTEAKYYLTPGANATSEPTSPNTSTSGTGQYGYLYNWCGAMGGQSTAACASASTPTPDTNISICPAGWRLPTGGSGGELASLNNAVNNGATNTDAGLRSLWIGQWSGNWYIGFKDQGSSGLYWSSTQASATVAYILVLRSSGAGSGAAGELGGYAVRCIAA